MSERVINDYLLEPAPGFMRRSTDVQVSAFMADALGNAESEGEKLIVVGSVQSHVLGGVKKAYCPDVSPVEQVYVSRTFGEICEAMDKLVGLAMDRLTEEVLDRLEDNLMLAVQSPEVFKLLDPSDYQLSGFSLEVTWSDSSGHARRNFSKDCLKQIFVQLMKELELKGLDRVGVEGAWASGEKGEMLMFLEPIFEFGDDGSLWFYLKFDSPASIGEKSPVLDRDFLQESERLLASKARRA